MNPSEDRDILIEQLEEELSLYSSDEDQRLWQELDIYHLRKQTAATTTAERGRSYQRDLMLATRRKIAHSTYNGTGDEKRSIQVIFPDRHRETCVVSNLPELYFCIERSDRTPASYTVTSAQHAHNPSSTEITQLPLHRETVYVNEACSDCHAAVWDDDDDDDNHES